MAQVFFLIGNSSMITSMDDYDISSGRNASTSNLSNLLFSKISSLRSFNPSLKRKKKEDRPSHSVIKTITKKFSNIIYICLKLQLYSFCSLKIQSSIEQINL